MTALSLGPRRDPLRPPEAPGLGRGMIFAAIAHAALLAALSAGVHWRTETLPAFEAELWSAVPQAAAPREQAPPEPEPVPAPTPVVKPAPPPPPQEDPQIQRDADIAIAKARDQKKREAEVKRLAELETERRKQLALKELKDKQERDKRADEKKQAQKLEDQQEKQQQKLQQQADKLKQDKAAKDADAKREAQRQENLRRIQGMAGASSGPSATGTALQSSGPSATYGGRIKARIRPNIIYNDTPVGNPVAEVEVRAAPDGTIIGRKLVKASGNAEWDNAVLRAIDKTETLPRDTDGRVPSLLVISFKPGE